MALKKDIVFDDKIKTNYHMISYYGVDKLNGIVHINVNSYASEETRNEEKQFIDNIPIQEELVSQLMNLDSEKDTELSESINNKLMEFPSNPNVCLKTTTFSIQPKDGRTKLWTVSDFYELLKTQELFTDAEDLL